jgi:hypothetical protein
VAESEPSAQLEYSSHLFFCDGIAADELDFFIRSLIKQHDLTKRSLGTTAKAAAFLGQSRKPEV